VIVGALFVISVVVVVLTVLGYIPWLVALPAIGIVVAVLLGYSMRRRGAEPPS
jgi:hypothetical protein